MPNYGQRRREGKAISTAWVESAINEIIAKRMSKRQQMRWNRWTVQPFLAVRTAVLNDTNKSYRVDETYIKVKGQEKYLYRAVDSTGQTIDFLLTAKRDAAAAKRFFQRVFSCSSNPIPRVINVDKNPAYPAAVRAARGDHGSESLALDSSRSRRSNC